MSKRNSAFESWFPFAKELGWNGEQYGARDPDQESDEEVANLMLAGWNACEEYRRLPNKEIK